MDRQRTNLWRVITGRAGPPAAETSAAETGEPAESQTLNIGPDDPLLAYLVSSPGVVNIEKLNFDSPAMKAMRASGVKLAVPLISHGELVGVLNLGPRLSEQEYNPDDARLLENLASQAAPALRVAQLARQQQAEARERERMEHELQVARLIQQTLLPKELPDLKGWEIAAFYRPARAVGGDFYDFLQFEDGKLGLVIGDVTDKGVPAAMVMATTRSILRAAAETISSPGDVLRRANNKLCPDIPPNMFVTCMYTLLDPESGTLRYANAGHDLPYRRSTDGISELRATGMPLGLMEDMEYEEKEIQLEPGESVLFYSDGLVEAHNPKREMFGFPRLRGMVASHGGGARLIDYLLAELAKFTGEGWEQEDDVAMITLARRGTTALNNPGEAHAAQQNQESQWQEISSFTVQSEPGNERQAIAQVEQAIQNITFPPEHLERLKTAVGEATMNAMEHGNRYQPEKLVKIRVSTSEDQLCIAITDRGRSGPIPDPQTPDIEAKLEGSQSPRGWGLFLIKNMVDDMRVSGDENHHTVELIFNRKGDQHAA